MTSVPYFFLLFFALTGHCFIRDDVFLKKYSTLISDVGGYYGTSSVFFLFSGNDRRLQEYTMGHSITRDLSQRGVISLIMKYDELHEQTKFYRRHIVRPLVVVLLNAMSEIREFQKTREMNTSYPVWLLIFTDEVGSPLCQYCRHPAGNSFHLRFDTEMLVSCCDDPVIKEWWSVFENRSEVAPFGRWTEYQGLHLLVSSRMYARRHDVYGAGLRIAIVGETGLAQATTKIANSYFGDVLMELKRAVNFTITVANPVESFGSYNSATKNWTGAVGQLTRREIDLGIGEFTMTNSRLDVIDFTLPLMLARTRLYIKQPDGSGVQWYAYFKAFSFEIWMTIIIVLIASSVLLTIIKKKESNGPAASLVAENYLCVWGLFCQQGLFKFPVETSQRIAYFSILISAVVIFTAYSASLTSFLTVNSPNMPFTSLAGFANDGSYKLIVIQNSSNYDLFVKSRNQLMKKMSKMMKPWTDLPKTFKEGFQQVCKERVAFYTNSAVKKALNKNITCTIVSVQTELVDSLAMAMAADNQYKGIMDYHFQRLQDNGILNRLKQKYAVLENPGGTTYDVVTLWGVAPILSVLAGGMIFSVLLMFFEKTYVFLKVYGHRWKHTMSNNTTRIKRLETAGKQPSSRTLQLSA